MPNDYKFQVIYRVPVNLMFETLTNPTEITKFTQCPAVFEKKQGGSFNLYDGTITGTNEEIIDRHYKRIGYENAKCYGKKGVLVIER